MHASSSGSMSAAGSSAGADAGSMTSSQRSAPSGRSPSKRTVMRASGASARRASRTGSTRSTRSPSAMSTLGRESDSPYRISSVVHHAFMPTTAAPIEITAQ